MDISYEDWKAIKNRTEQELIPHKGTGKDPKAKFTDKSFSWDYYYSYPPGSVRLNYEWKNGKVSGWRSPHLNEGPFAPAKIEFDEEYLARVFDIRRLND